jgi:hypothetical protein
VRLIMNRRRLIGAAYSLLRLAVCGCLGNLLAAATVYGLLDDGDLAILTAGIRVVSLGNSGADRRMGHLLASSADQRYLYALLPNEIVVIQARTLQVVKRISLDRDGRMPGVIQIGPQTGLLYLFSTGRIRAIDPGSGAMLHDWAYARAEGFDWNVYSAAVSSDEKTLYVGYHGSDPANGVATSGADWFTRADDLLARCEAPAAASNRGCMNAHGHIAVTGGTVVAATGEQFLLSIDAATHAAKFAYDTGLTGNHLMEFTVSQPRRMIWAVGSCLGAGGLTGLPLDPGVLGQPTLIRNDFNLPLSGEMPRYRFADICGDRVAVSPSGGTVAAAGTKEPNAASSTLYVLDVGRMFPRSIQATRRLRDVLVLDE